MGSGAARNYGAGASACHVGERARPTAMGRPGSFPGWMTGVTVRVNRLILSTRNVTDFEGFDGLEADRTGFDCMLDAAHTAMLLCKEDGAKGCEVFLKSAGLLTDGAFKALLQALLNAIPRTQSKGKFVRPEAAIVDDLRLAFFDDLVVPVEEVPKVDWKQGQLLDPRAEPEAAGDEGIEGEEDSE